MSTGISADQREAVVREARAWIGTPWHHQGRLRGVGVDCVMLLCEVYERVGVLPHVVPAPYPIDTMLHRSGETVLPYLNEYGFEVPAPEIGDTVVYHFGRSFSHAGIYAGDGQIIHAYRATRMVIESGIDEGRLLGRARLFYSIRGG